jgi:hypothetical protein
MNGISDVPVDAERDLEFDQAFELLLQLVDLQEADEIQPLGRAAVYTTSVVLWLLVYQRLRSNTSLSGAVKHLLKNAPRVCPDNRRIREDTLSASTAAYSAARKRLMEETVEWFMNEVSQSICAATGPTLGKRRIFLVDGTTMALAPTEALRAQFPPASNQHGESVWPIALITAVHELESGCALLPEIGAMYGPQAVSEVELARACFKRMPPNSIVLADAGFGIFSVAWAATTCGHNFILRLTAQRYRALLKKSKLLQQGKGWATYTCAWKPSYHDLKKTPQIPSNSEYHVRLHVVTLPGGGEMYFVTDLLESAQTIGAIYAKRMDVETDIRDIKVVLDLEHIQARNPSMFRKEFLTSMVAYNLVIQFRRQAAELAKVPPRRLSFTGVWTTYREFLLDAWSNDPAEWRNRYRKALRVAMQDKLPNRPGRSYPREVYTKAPKSVQFKKRKPKPKETIHQPKPT